MERDTSLCPFGHFGGLDSSREALNVVGVGGRWLGGLLGRVILGVRRRWVGGIVRTHGTVVDGVEVEEREHVLCSVQIRFGQVGGTSGLGGKVGWKRRRWCCIHLHLDRYSGGFRIWVGHGDPNDGCNDGGGGNVAMCVGGYWKCNT